MYIWPHVGVVASGRVVRVEKLGYLSLTFRRPRRSLARSTPCPIFHGVMRTGLAAQHVSDADRDVARVETPNVAMIDVSDDTTQHCVCEDPGLASKARLV